MQIDLRCARRWALVFILLAMGWRPVAVPAATVPAGFQDQLVASGLSAPTSLAFSPDGRLFIAQKVTGRIRVVKNGTLLTTPFLNVNDFIPNGMFFDTYFERGLIGVAFDPGFATNNFVYIYYTICKVPNPNGTPGTSTGCTTAKNRVARVRANGDVVASGSHVVVLDDIDSDNGNHNGGWLGFGPLDGKLYVSTGDGGSVHTKSQDLNSLSGKVLRVNADGTVPSDNPYFGQAGKKPQVWASGLRNPWRCRFHPDGRFFCADVGQNTWEEIDVILPGLNYGWPTVEGPFNTTTFPQFTHPIHWYAHGGSGASITGGDFGSRTVFPGDHQQSYYFADFVDGFIRQAVLDASGVAVASVSNFVTGIGSNSVTDLVAGPDGALYYASYSGSSVRKIVSTTVNRAPTAQAAATPDQGDPPLDVTFSSAGTSDPDGDTLTYTWDFGDGTPISNAPNPVHTYSTLGQHVATLVVSDGSLSDTATVLVTVGSPPVITIDEPTDGALWRAGDTLPLSGSAVDPEDGPLSPSLLHWEIIFHHFDHVHPYIDDLPGSPNSFVVADDGETDDRVWYEVVLRATDSDGLSSQSSVLVFPVKSTFTLVTDPPGLTVTLDGQPQTTPVTVTSVVNFKRTIGTPSPQTVGAEQLLFLDWSDGGAQTHVIQTAESATTYVATFASTCDAATPIPPQGGTFTGTTSGVSTLAAGCANSSTAPERVFEWTPTASGTAQVQTCGTGTSFDTVLYVHGGTCGTGAEVACNDDTIGCNTGEPNDRHGSRVSFAVTAGQTYYIAVDGFSGKSGNFVLTVTPPSGPATTSTTSTSTSTSSSTSTAPPTTSTSTSTSTTAPPTTSTSTTLPPNACFSPTALPAEGGSFSGATSGASTQAGTCGVSGTAPENAFSWVAPRTGTAVFETCGATAYDTVLYARSGDCTGGPQVACNDDTSGCAAGGGANRGSRLTLAVTAGQTYFVFVDGFSGNSGTYVLTVTPPGETPTTTSTSTSSTLLPTTTSTSTTSSTLPPTTTTSTTTSTSSTSTSTSTTLPPSACLAPTALPAEGGTFTGATSGASTEAGTCGASALGPENVFSWVAPRTGTAVFETCGATAYDTVLYARSGSCSAGPQLACNDDTPGCGAGGGPNRGSRLSLAVTAGQTYFVFVDGYNGGSGSYTLTVSPPSEPSTTTTSTSSSSTSTSTSSSTTTTTLAPNACLAPVILPAEGGTFTGTTSGPSTQAGTCGQSGLAAEDAFSWTAPRSGIAVFETCGATAYDTVLYARSGSCTNGAQLDCDDDTTGCSAGGGPNRGSRLTLAVTAGQTYFVFVDGFSGKNGDYALTVRPPPPPTTTSTSTSSTSTTTSSTTTTTLQPSACAEPIVVPPAGGTFSASTAGTSTLAGACGNTASAPEQVYQWTPASSGSATIETCGAGTAFDTVLYVRSGTCGNGAGEQCNDDTVGCAAEGNPNRGSRVVTSVVAGQTYFIVVDGYSTDSGAFTLTITPPVTPTTSTSTSTSSTSSTSTSSSSTSTTSVPTPTTTSTTLAPADPCENPTPLPPPGGTFAGTTTGASFHAGTCGSSGTAPEKVFEWVPPASGMATIQTCGAGTLFDTVLYVRRESCGTGQQLACNDDTGGCTTGQGDSHASRVTIPVVAGETYFIFVDGFSSKRGDFSLSVSLDPCLDPTVVPAAGGTFAGTTLGASALTGSCSRTDIAPERVFSWTPAASGQALIETCGATTFDTVLYFRAADCAGGSTLSCNDDSGSCPAAGTSSRGSRIRPTVTAGQTYFIVVDGFNGAQGDFSLAVNPPGGGAALAREASICGDVNTDGMVDAGDALAVAQFGAAVRTCGAAPFRAPRGCDAVPDGRCDGADTAAIMACDVDSQTCPGTCGPFACSASAHGAEEPAPPGAAQASLEVTPAALRPGTDVTVDVILTTGATPLGAYGASLEFDSEIFDLVAVGGGSSPAFADAPAHHATPGRVSFGAVQVTGLSEPVGTVDVARITLRVRQGVASTTTSLGLAPRAAYSTAGALVVVEARGSSVRVLSADATESDALAEARTAAEVLAEALAGTTAECAPRCTRYALRRLVGLQRVLARAPTAPARCSGRLRALRSRTRSLRSAVERLQALTAPVDLDGASARLVDAVRRLTAGRCAPG